MNNIYEIEKEEGEFKDKIVISLFDNISKFLNHIKRKPRATYSEINEAIHFSSGLIYKTIRDIKIMQLVTNGYGLNLTNLGERWLKDVDEVGKVSNDTLKEACLNVPLFKQIYEENETTTGYKELFNEFSKLAPKNVDRKLIGSALKRYLEGIHNIKIRTGSKITRINKPKKSKFDIDINRFSKPQKKDVYDEAIDIVTEIVKLKEKYGKEKILQVLNKL